MTVDQVWQKWYQNRDPRDKQWLVDYYYKVAVRYIMQAAAIFKDILTDVDQLISNAGYEVLIAVGQYDPTKKKKFTSYLFKRMQWAVWNMMRDKDNLSEYERRLVKQYRRAKAGWKSTTQTEPTDEEICAKLGVPVQQMQQIRAKDLLKDVPLNALPDYKIDDIMAQVAVKCHIPTPSEIIERRDMVQKILSYLDERNRQIFILRFLYGLTTKEISKIIGTISAGGIESMLKRQRVKIRAFFVKDDPSLAISGKIKNG